MPQRELGFAGTPQREMVTLLPCSDCLVSLVDKPPFLASVADVEHVHFERVIFNGKSFDMVLIFKAGVREKGEDEFVRITAIPMKALDGVKTWLDNVAELTFTEGVGSFAWKSIIDDIVRRDDFYEAEDETSGEPKPVGWDFLRSGKDEEEGDEEEEDDDVYSEEQDDDDEEEDDDDDEFDDAVDDEEDDDDEDFDEDDDSDAADWDELEAKAAAEDRKRHRDDDEDDAPRGKSGKKGGSGGAATKKPRRA